MPDGRTHPHARVAAVATATLTLLGIGLATANPASAAPGSSDMDAVQARVDRLSEQAEVTGRRHARAHTTLNGSRTQLGKLTIKIKRERQVIDTLRTQIAASVVGEQTKPSRGSAGTDALTEDSKVLLTNLALVSQDTGGRGNALANTSVQLQESNQRRVPMRALVTRQVDVEKNLHAQDQKLDARSSAARATLARLKEEAAKERMARLGGPVVAYAKSQVGKTYVWGAAGPDAFDCSGLTMMAWQQAGVSLPHNSTAQSLTGQRIAKSELQPGDLVFYYSPISHVGIYIGNGQIVSALNPSAGINVRGLDDMPFTGAVRPG